MPRHPLNLTKFQRSTFRSQNWPRYSASSHWHVMFHKWTLFCPVTWYALIYVLGRAWRVFPYIRAAFVQCIVIGERCGLRPGTCFAAELFGHIDTCWQGRVPQCLLVDNVPSPSWSCVPTLVVSRRCKLEISVSLLSGTLTSDEDRVLR